MSNVDVPHDDNSAGNEIESPVDGPTPDWMKMATSSKSEPSLTEESTPDWLKDIKSGGSEQAVSTADDSFNEMSDLERLLAEEGVDLNSVEEERPAEAEGMSARDWMISTSDDEMIRNRIGEVEFEDIETMPKAEASVAEDDSFAGMSDLERLLAEEGVDLDSVEEERPAEAEGMSARDWMISTSDDEMIRNRIGEVEFEESLSTSKSGPVLESSATPAEQEATIAGDLPDWLRDVEEDEPILPAVAEKADSDSQIVAEDLPDWLRDVEEDEQPPEPIVVDADDDDDKMVVAEDLPDWLRDVEEEVKSEPLAIRSEEPSGVDGEEDLPDWLRDVEEEFVTEPEAASIVGGEDGGDKMVVAEDLPDWLRDVEEGELPQEEVPLAVEAVSIDEDGLPDWLQDEEASTREDHDFIEAAASVSGADDIIEEDELPDWLQEVEIDAENVKPHAEVADLFTDEEEEELPEWLTEAQDQDDEAFEPSEPAPLDLEEMAEDDLPDWLLEMEDAPDVATADEEPVVEFSAESAVADDDGLIEEADLPDWLQDVDDEVVEPVAEVAAVPSVIEEPELVKPEVEPDIPVEAEAVPEPEVEPKLPEKPAPVSEPAAEPDPEPEAATLGVPDWLKKLREGEPQPAPSPAPEPVVPVPVVAAVAPVAVALPPPSPPPVPAATPQEVLAQPVAVPAVALERAVIELPDNPDEQLKMAQAAQDENDIDKAAFIYEHLVNSGSHLDTIINDVEMAIRSYPSNYRLHQVKGDAMMRDGRLQGALESYRQALEHLSS